MASCYGSCSVFLTGCVCNDRRLRWKWTWRFSLLLEDCEYKFRSSVPTQKTPVNVVSVLAVRQVMLWADKFQIHEYESDLIKSITPCIFSGIPRYTLYKLQSQVLLWKAWSQWSKRFVSHIWKWSVYCLPWTVHQPQSHTCDQPWFWGWSHVCGIQPMLSSD